jgi:hypothetical protein
VNNIFYIVEHRDGVFHLRLVGNHQCISTGEGISSLLETAKRYLRKYKTADRIVEVIDGLDSSLIKYKHAEALYRKEYEQGKHLPFEELLDSVVIETLREVRENSLQNKLKVKLRRSTPLVYDDKLEERVERVDEEPSIGVKKGLVLSVKRLQVLATS